MVAVGSALAMPPHALGIVAMVVRGVLVCILVVWVLVAIVLVRRACCGGGVAGLDAAHCGGRVYGYRARRAVGGMRSGAGRGVGEMARADKGIVWIKRWG